MRKLLALGVVLVAGLGVSVSAAAGAVEGVRGTQIFAVTLEPSGDPNGSGRALVAINADEETVCYAIVVRNIGEPQEPAPGLGSAHIHVLPSGAIAVDLEATFTMIAPATFLAADCVEASGAVLTNIVRNPGLYYVNIHTAAFPGGAVQGSLG